jgi:aminopeptidase N
MKKILSLVSIFLIGTSIQAQEGGHHCSRLKSHSILNQSRSNTLGLDYIALTEEYDVNFYFLDVNLERTATDISGVVEIHATSKVNVLDTVLFELHDNLAINSILVDGVTNTSFTRVGSAVIVPTTYTNGDNFIITVDYAGTPPNAATNPLGGGGMTTGTSGTWGNQVTWTLSEPFSAFEWFPCKQSLTDKADSVYVFVTTDTANMAGSNGVLTNVVNVGNGKERYEWKSNYAIDYYLISIAVAEYVEYNVYANPTGAANPILIQNFVYNNPATLPNFQTEIDNTADFLEYFSEIYGMYPFANEKYGHCMAPFGGGMEHQTMTSQGWFEDGLTAHELGHQWWGDNVTCATWADIWLNEGFATYSDYLMVEHFQSAANAFNQMNGTHSNVMSQNGGSVYCLDSLNTNRIFSGRLTYDKGAAIIHTLRFLVNDDPTFFNILKTYQTTFTDSTARLDDFKLIAETVSGLDLTNFFNEWYYGEGFPTYSAQWNKINDNVVIELSQTSSMVNVTPLFTNDIEIRVTGTNGLVETQIFSVNGNTVSLSLPFTEDVISVQIDPNNWVLNEIGTITENTGLVSIEEKENEILIYPNPVVDELFISNSNEFKEALLFDVKGQMVNSFKLVDGLNSVSVKNLSKGTYILKMGTITKEFVKK